ncbi:C6 transcription factor [Fusarium oxysporum II5]|uniref:Transcriptional activator ARO80 n=2 Tax=Fusarium oxysporum f. sp. cubense (strain race 4) TaxID=2502994 RepID=N1RBR2_FUSC4|nr:uncharacterized protein FOIG_09536 [Fusarium odoratissimum NRRL 54006]EMT62979.1 Transcriptional activator ARO80 [Fusarium odoratissimum]EXL98814.1 hypothetical protein FOIG_09536 [Fusarium odoratissimum NRRL 54006]KAK2129157.1 C6 transcription factor [Fusarium oxysporum II5]
MTPTIGQRSYQACLTCRRRKTKCYLDGVGEPGKPPCVYCHETGTQCVLAESNRGRGVRSRRQTRQTASSLRGSTTFQQAASESHSTSYPSYNGDESAVISNSTDENDDADYTQENTENGMRMELRNPSDALQILAHSNELESSPSGSVVADTDTVNINSPTHTSTQPPPFKKGPGSTPARRQGSPSDSRSKPSFTVLDNYELIQRGILHPALLPELLHIFSQNYHHYCPIVPSYLLGTSLCMERIQKADQFLLTALLTIASRDSPKHYLTHRYCWDYAQQLLLEIALANPWTHTPQTIAGLLLLSEWLPHIQSHTRPNGPKNLVGEDQTAWSLVGLAIRLGYLIRLDQAAFRGGNNHSESNERKRLIWIFIYLADRQISVRLGQSFWSRGPSLSSSFTARDFPSLRQLHGMEGGDLASVLHSTLELTQILYNAHGILYSSASRTLSLIRDGDYARYMDDFSKATTTWHTAWSDIEAPPKIKSTLALMYEYVCLYVNAFSFQAVLSRFETLCSESQGTTQKRHCNVFSTGIMASPDGPYIYAAIGAARNLLQRMISLEPRQILCHLPSRYYSYGLYAAVFLYKVLKAGAVQSDTQKLETMRLAHRFISVMDEAASVDLHICRTYSGMLRRLWNEYETSSVSTQGSQTSSASRVNVAQSRRIAEMSGPQAASSTRVNTAQVSSSEDDNMLGNWDGMGEGGNMMGGVDSHSRGFDTNSTQLSVERYLLGSFWPGIAEFSKPPPSTLTVGSLNCDTPEDWMEGMHDFGYVPETGFGPL